jgi:hypothetical protein
MKRGANMGKTAMLTELCLDCVDRYRAELFTEVTDELARIVADLESAKGIAQYAERYGNLHTRIKTLAERYT